MPDVFVPVSNEEEDEYLNQLLRKSIVFQFAFDYTDKNRTELMKYSTPESFFNGFEISDGIFDELVATAREAGIKASRKEIRRSEEKTRILLKAYIGRNLLDDPAFYPVYHQIDEGFQKGYEEVRKIRE